MPTARVRLAVSDGGVGGGLAGGLGWDTEAGARKPCTIGASLRHAPVSLIIAA